MTETVARPVVTVLDPADGSVVGSVPVAGAADVDLAVRSARAAAAAWARTPAA
ncbi:MAG: hypothetical protein JWM15_3583, partial [Cryptosporangiaceae bacterium]|nr:hypothetical protein [Cryptosporangiaceae bacterium]